MHEQTSKLLVQRIDLLAKNAVDPFSTSAVPIRHISAEGVAFDLIGESPDMFQDVLRILLEQEDWSQKFSESYLENQLHHILACVLKDDLFDKIPSFLSDLEHTLNAYSQERTAYVPIHGLQMSVETLSIGQVVLKPINERDFKALLDRVKAITQSLRSTPEDQAGAFQIEQTLLEQNIRGQVCAEFRAIAEPTRAQERAEEEANRAIDLLRYSIPSLYPESFRVFVGLQGDVTRSARVIPIISADDKEFNIHSHLVGAIYPFEINQLHLDHMAKIGVFKLSDLLSRPASALTEFESTTLRAIHWYANAQIQEESENKFINYITCLEAFLTPRDSNPIGTAIAEAVAIFLADKLEDRKRLKKRMLELYRLRSAVSHGGHKAILDSQLNALKHIAGSFAMLMTNNMDKYKSQKDLLDAIESAKLGGE